MYIDMYKMIFSIGEAWSQSLSKLSKLRKRLLVRKRLLWKRCRPRQSLLPKLLLEICPILLQSPRLPQRCRQVSCRRPRLTRSSGMSWIVSPAVREQQLIRLWWLCGMDPMKTSGGRSTSTSKAMRTWRQRRRPCE